MIVPTLRLLTEPSHSRNLNSIAIPHHNQVAEDKMEKERIDKLVEANS